MTEKLNAYFLKTVKVSRIRRGQHQELETMLNEEAYLLAQYIRGEREVWKPRVAIPQRV
jgi:hypothetical protein